MKCFPMSTILLSIHPEYVRQILAGSKKFEFRRNVAKRHVDRILIYSTFPEMKVVASVAVLGVLKESPSKLWQKTKDFSGISRDKYMEYFSKREFAYAYQLGEVTMFKEPKNLSDYGITTAPQSFAYIDA